MPFKLPSEVVVDSFLPAFRSELASTLDERGLTQVEIAERIGVSQPAVSKYVAGDVEPDPIVAEDPKLRAAVERLAEGIEAGDVGEFEMLGVTLELVQGMEDRGPICELHEREMPSLRGRGCDLCVRDDGNASESLTLDAVRRAAREFAATPGAADVVPAVGTNVAQALPDAETELDVAAIPGRIYAARGGVHVPAAPEFGASQNVAVTVLAAMRAAEAAGELPSLGAVNVATRDALLEAAEALEMEVVEFDAEREGREARLTSRFEHGVPDVAFHRGEFGVEPVTYVLGEDALSAVEEVSRLLSTCESLDSGRNSAD